MRNILFCGNSKVFDGVLTCMLSVLKRTHATDPFCFYIFTMDMTRIRPEYTPISEDMTNFLECVAKKFHPPSRSFRTNPVIWNRSPLPPPFYE